jgi:hypothetical protein
MLLVVKSVLNTSEDATLFGCTLCIEANPDFSVDGVIQLVWSQACQARNVQRTNGIIVHKYTP